MRGGWRRRPDLNRGWRFCRLSRVAYVVDSPCFLVAAKASFYPVFGRLWTQIGPKFSSKIARNDRGFNQTIGLLLALDGLFQGSGTMTVFAQSLAEADDDHDS